ncbi:hypothetical protein [Amycolatopsis decaplanina]|uniref:DUF4388 domain-containing protein n=1 Tax=Amycolatopsis decaplanina DSM 44594 TaxID=1284240 RepID=M2XSC4_9PSEU|nr:hypothetical protein [Amycolatopsis decaplanina]EME63896.1 hypothetical protein H074_04744 [Amycolatopsis decaplanina DSM 44594]
MPRSSFDLLARALTVCCDDGVSGALYLSGRPGGVIHLRDGAVIAVETPGAPGVDALLLRSGRISEADWSAALRAGRGGPTPRDELLARAGIGNTELQLVATMAAQDGAFVIVAGDIEEYAIAYHRFDVLLPVTPAIELDWLLDETRRRLDALASLPVAVSPHRDRIAPVAGTASPTVASTAARRDILAGTNGRRSARDIAFVLGRNVFPVTIEISRMIGDGLVEIAVEAPEDPGGVSLKPLRPRMPAAGAQPVPDGDTNGLPLRSPGASGVSELLKPSRAAGWQVLPRLLNRVRAGPAANRTNSDEISQQKGISGGS